MWECGDAGERQAAAVDLRLSSNVSIDCLSCVVLLKDRFYFALLHSVVVSHWHIERSKAC